MSDLPPPLPRPVPPVDSPEYQRWRVLFQEWVDRKHERDSRISIGSLAPAQVPGPRGYQIHRTRKRVDDADSEAE